jgi:hypothetical protein
LPVYRFVYDSTYDPHCESCEHHGDCEVESLRCPQDDSSPDLITDCMCSVSKRITLKADTDVEYADPEDYFNEFIRPSKPHRVITLVSSEVI